mmetsp:Transcript_25921/g.40576  ORF Transcript_25921/g.40576 Transcript_25921/m.40576 type:complete len:175 (+) Transcript_25921:89-613(+)
MDLSLPIPKKFQGRDALGGKGRECRLQDCLDQFVEEETLDGNNQYYCSRCKKHQNATKTMKIFRLPPVLVLHMKRFDKKSFSRSKLATTVKFPVQQLDLADYTAVESQGQSTVYDLYGITNHSGSLEGGHYIAHCKNFDDNKWYCYNDSRVSTVGSEPPVDNSAYLLFYARVDC